MTVLGDGPNDDLTLSENGAALITDYEKPVLHFYDDSKHHCTVGTGHLVSMASCTNVTQDFTFEDGSGLTKKNVNQYPITQALNDELFKQDTAKHVVDVQKYIKIRLTQDQFDALVILSFNHGLGASPKLVRAINTGASANTIIAEWRNILGEPNLKYRRNDELELFFTGDSKRDYKTTYYKK